MKLPYILLITVIMLLRQITFSQVYIGDRFPSINIDHVLYTYDNKLNTQRLNNKYVILEFGTTYCGPCMASFKKMNLLKKIYGDRLDFYMVTPQKMNDVQRFLSHQKLDSLIYVPIITQDTVLKNTFRHVAIPHLVWINTNGKIVAVTNHEYLNQQNIDLFLSQDKLNWPIKWDFPYDTNHNMLIFNPINFQKINRPTRFFYSVISNHMEGVLKAADIRKDTINNEIVVTGRNLSLINIYLRHLCRNLNSNLFASQIMFDGIDSNIIFYQPNFSTRTEWDIRNSYSYEFVFPLDFSMERINNTILKQFDVYLNYNVSLEVLKRPCWVLYHNENKLNAKGHPKARKIDGLLRSINRIYNHKPIVLSDNFDKNLLNNLHFLLDINDYDNLSSINKSLAPYGLNIREQDYEIETLIFRKN